MAFKKNSPGCCACTGATGCSGPTTLTVTVLSGCSGAILAATVTITKGAFTTSGTTDASGVVSFDVQGPGAGTYTVTCSGAARHNTTASSKVVVCNTDNTLTVNMAVNATYACHTYHCPLPIPKTLFVTDPLGNVTTLTYGAFNAGQQGRTGSSFGWSGSIVHPTNADCYVCPFDGSTFGGHPTVNYELGTSQGLMINSPARPSKLCEAACPSSLAVSNTGITETGACNPVNIAASVTGPGQFSLLYGGSGPWTFTITE